MKKFGMGLAILMLICLCSCSSGSKRTVIRDNPTDAIMADLNLTAVQNGKSINSSLDRTKEFYDILVADDTKSSLFYQTIQLDEYIESDRLKQMNLKILYFNKNIPSNDVVGFLKEMNSKETGITASSLGIEFKEKENVSASLCSKLATSYTVTLPKDFTVQANDPIQLVIMYLPVYCIYNDGSQDLTKVFLFVPVYYAFTYQSAISEYTSGVKEYALELEKPNEKEEVYLLPSKKEE
ncbi:MAG: hypothetical protein K2N65_05025 [Anaeroplasmataceae bacterium]|nr:hypothetical protein [Anaeroplasmataceae bacterium]